MKLLGGVGWCERARNGMYPVSAFVTCFRGLEMVSELWNFASVFY